MNLLQKIANQSYKTACSLKKDKSLLHENVTILKNLVRKVVLADLNLNPKLLENQPLYVSNNVVAPTSYVDVWRDENFTMGVFVLKPGTRLPLHDHPHMYGLIKVLYGSCVINSFSKKDYLKSNKTSVLNLTSNVSNLAYRHVDVHATTSSDVIMLTPDVANLHEIHALASPIAFFDVLFPPYNDEDDRPCNYYKVLNHSDNNEVELIKIEAPVDYWTDNESYMGPVINKEHVYDISSPISF